MIVLRSRFHAGILRAAPSGLDRLTAGAVRSGCLRLTPHGTVWLPLGVRLVDKIRSLLRAVETDSGRLAGGTDPARSVFASFMGLEPRSHKELPLLLTAESSPVEALSDDLRSAGSMGVLEWGAAADGADAADANLREAEQSLLHALRECGLEPVVVSSGPTRQVWAFLAEDGPAEFLRCRRCSATSEADLAVFALPVPAPASPEELREVETPGARTIPLLCEQLGIPASSTLKALFLTTSDGATFLAVLRGDLEASLPKLRAALGTADVRPAAPQEVRTLGVAPGYARPGGLTVRESREGAGVWVVGDRSIAGAPNLVTGANREGVHLAGVNYPRDFAVTEIVDFARPPRGAACGLCGGELAGTRGWILAKRERLEGGFVFAAADGTQKPGAVATIRVFIEPVVASVLATSLQPNGMRYPRACAPFHVHVIVLPGGLKLQEGLEAIAAGGFDVLVDDRDVSAGLKLAEADWVGAPAVIISGRRSAEAGGVELRVGRGDARIVAVDSLAEGVSQALGEVM